MNTKKILSIIALSLLGLCFLCGLAKMVMKKDSDKKNCDKVCSMAIFAAVVLIGVSQLFPDENYADPGSNCATWDQQTGVWTPPNCGPPGSGFAPMCGDTYTSCQFSPDLENCGSKCCCKHMTE